MAHPDAELKELSRKISTATAEDLNNEAFRRRILESSIEIRELESKLKMAYILKERRKQVEEKEAIRAVEKEITVQEREEAEQQRLAEQELEDRRLLYEKWKKVKYCRELVDQAAQYRLQKWAERDEERQLDQMHLDRILRAEMRREKREREERDRKKRRLAEELRECVRLQEQWKAIQRLVEAEEDRVVEEFRKHQRRLSQIQQEERKKKADQLANIRQRLKRALEMEEKRRMEREELWIEYGCEEKEEAEERKRLEEEELLRAQKSERKRHMEEQMELEQMKKLAAIQEAQHERLWILEQAALDEKMEKEEAERRRAGRSRLQEEQLALLEFRRKQREEMEAKEAEEKRKEEERQEAEDRMIAEERRRILHDHAPLLLGFLPPGLFRDPGEVPEDVRDHLIRRSAVRIQDDPDLW